MFFWKKEKSVPFLWRYAGLILGIIICGYMFGFSTTGDIAERIIHISILWTLIGAVCGAIVGYQLAIVIYYFLDKKFPWVIKIDFFLLGPFNFMSLRSLNNIQLRILWPGIAFLFLLGIYPPWIAYPYMSGGKGHGEKQFMGFHFINASSYDVVGEAPYMAPEINYLLWGIFCVLVMLTICLLILICNTDKTSK